MVALVIALVAGVVVAVNYVGQANAVDAANSGRQAALKTASTAVVDMITTDYQHPDEYIAKLKPLAAGQFLSTFVNAGKGLTSILQQGKVQTTGSVVSSGVQKYAGDTATITVVAYETVKNTQTPQGSQRAYRMVLSMIKSGNQWLVSNVEFVK
jgi:Mce-associated membrane protein